MAFGKLLEKADQLKTSAEHLTGAATESANKLLEHFNDAIPTLKGLGLTVSNVHLGMGILPEIQATLTGSIEAVDPAKIQELIDSNKEKERDFLTLVLRSLQAASRMKDQISAAGFKGVKVDLKLGLPPHVSVGFLQ